MERRRAVPLALAVSAPARARGLLFGGEEDAVLLLAPCKDVHTMGMRRRIDVAFVDAAGMVLESYRDVGPCCRLRNGLAAVVLERPSAHGAWFEAGERVGLSPLLDGTQDSGEDFDAASADGDAGGIAVSVDETTTLLSEGFCGEERNNR